MKRRFSSNELKILNYGKIRERSGGTIKRKSHGHDVVKNNQRIMLGLSSKNDKYKEYSANKSIKNDSINHINTPLIIVLFKKTPNIVLLKIRSKIYVFGE